MPQPSNNDNDNTITGNKLYQVLSGLYTTDSKIFNRLSGHQANEFNHITSAETSYSNDDIGRVIRKDNELYLVKSNDSVISEERIIDDSEFSDISSEISGFVSSI